MITIVGGGLTGPFLAIALRKCGFKVELFEKLNKSKVKKNRSINLSLSARGMGALKHIGLDKQVIDVTVKTLGRVIHFPKEVSKYTYCSNPDNNYLYTIERDCLQKVLYDECLRLNININEELECKDYDPSENSLTIFDLNKNKSFKLKRDLIIGADGSNSIIRKSLQEKNLLEVTRKFSSYGYKKFFIPKTIVNKLKLELEYVHFWSRKGFFCMGLANMDGSFTGGIVLPQDEEIEGNPFFNMDKIAFKESLNNFFPDLSANVPEFSKQLIENPMNSFSMHTCSTWSYLDKSCLVGDSAHSILPWFAQGVNCGLAECVSFIKILKEHPNDLKRVFQLFEYNNKINSDAIAKLSENNFEELLWNINPANNDGLQLSPELEKKMKIYGKVAFTEIPYSQILNELNLLKANNLELGTSKQSW